MINERNYSAMNCIIYARFVEGRDSQLTLLPLELWLVYVVRDRLDIQCGLASESFYFVFYHKRSSKSQSAHAYYNGIRLASYLYLSHAN